MARRIRTHAEWNVETHIVRTTGPTSTPTRSRISAAALLVNVIARIFERRDALVDQMGDAVGEHPRLARAGPRHHQQRPVLVDDRVELVGVQTLGERRRAAPTTPERARILVVELELADRIGVGPIDRMWDVGEEFVVGHGDVHSTEGL